HQQTFDEHLVQVAADENADATRREWRFEAGDANAVDIEAKLTATYVHGQLIVGVARMDARRVRPGDQVAPLVVGTPPDTDLTAIPHTCDDELPRLIESVAL